MRIRIGIRLVRPSTQSSLETGIEFEVRPDESRLDHINAAERLIADSFPGWQISAMQFT